MTQADMIDLVAERCECSREKAADAVRDLMRSFVEELARGDRVQLAGVGSLVRVATAARSGTAGLTGRPFTVPAGHRIKFSQAAAMKERLVQQR